MFRVNFLAENVFLLVSELLKWNFTNGGPHPGAIHYWPQEKSLRAHERLAKKCLRAGTGPRPDGFWPLTPTIQKLCVQSC